MEDERNQPGFSGTQDTTRAQGKFQEKAKKEGEKLEKKPLDIKKEPEASKSFTKGRKLPGKTTRSLSKGSEDESEMRSRASFAGVAAAAKAGRQLQVQLLKRAGEKSKGEEESKGKGREKNPPASAVAIAAALGRGSVTQNSKEEGKSKEPLDKEEPDDAALNIGSNVKHVKSEHAALIGLLRRRKERMEKDGIKERKDSKGEELKLKDGKQREKDGKEEEMMSPVILGSEKERDAKPEQLNLLHVGTPFEVLNFTSRIISPYQLVSLSPGLLSLWTSGRYRSRHPFISQVSESSTLRQMEKEDVKKQQ